MFSQDFPDTNRSLPARPSTGSADPHLGRVHQRPGVMAQVCHHVGDGAQPDAVVHLAATLGQQRPHLGDAARDRRAVYPEPRGHHVMGQPMSQVHQRGQQAVGEPEPMLRASADAATTCSRGEPIPVTSLPPRCQFSDQARDRFPGTGLSSDGSS